MRSAAEIDFFFSDVIMPGGMNGARLAVEARRLRPGLKVLLTSGYTAEALAKEHVMPDDLCCQSPIAMKIWRTSSDWPSRADPAAPCDTPTTPMDCRHGRERKRDGAAHGKKPFGLARGGPGRARGSRNADFGGMSQIDIGHCSVARVRWCSAPMARQAGLSRLLACSRPRPCARRVELAGS